MAARVDLHCHTTASDGLLTPRELVELAVRSSVDVIGVSDHDTVAGVDEARAAAAAADGLEVVPSIELSARWEGRNVHVLGPFIDHRSPVLLDELASLRTDRERRATGMVELLNGLGYELTMDEVHAQAGGPVIARPHIARALVARGYVPSVRDAFTPALIADGGAADVTKRALSPVQAVQLIVAAGGAPVVAHPGVGHHDGAPQPLSVDVLGEMTDAGMVGLEVDHPDHDPLMREHMAAVAADLGLVACGGSDFHGDEGHVLCRESMSAASLERLRTAARR